MKEFIIALINGQLAACNSVLIDLAKAKRRWKEKKVMFGLCFVALMAQLVWRHSCGVDRLPVVVRFSAGP